MKRLAWMVLLLPALAWADAPVTFGVGGLVTQGGDCCQFSYQGAAIFRLYDAAEGGNKAWEEQQASITVDGGMFHAELGAVTAFGATTFDGPRWLEIELTGGPGKLAPRTPLSSVPFAMFAGDAKKVGGVAPADLARKADVDAALAKKADLDALKHVSGSRLKARWLQGEDGSRQFVDWWDAVLQKACTFHVAADGEYRCLPKMNSSNLSVYYDYTCGKQVVTYLGPCDMPDYLVLGSGGTGCNSSSYYTVGASYAGDFYYMSNGTCTKNGGYTNDGHAYYVGDQVYPSTFAHATMEQDK